MRGDGRFAYDISDLGFQIGDRLHPLTGVVISTQSEEILYFYVAEMQDLSLTFEMTSQRAASLAECDAGHDKHVPFVH